MNERRLTNAELEASRWIARLEASDVTLADHQRFREWLAASPENRAAHEALSRTWDRLDALKFLGAGALTMADATHSPRLSRRILVLGAGAAALAGGAVFALLSAAPQAAYAAEFEAPIGGRKTARLPDGSIVDLNADTHLRATFTDGARVVILERGEAAFVVGRDRRPFRVETNSGWFVATDTTFCVALMTSGARASVISGSIEAIAPGRSPLQAHSTQEVVLDDGVARVITLGDTRVQTRMAWRDDALAFDDEPLAEAALQVTRQTGVRFEFATADLAALRVGGYIRARDLNAFVVLLEQNLGLTASQSGHSIRLSRRD